MFGSKSLSLPSPFLSDHQHQRLYSEPVRPQPSGQCHFLVLHAGSREQRCPCQGYQQNRGAPGNVCDCNHAACYHAHTPQNEAASAQEGFMNTGGLSPGLMDRVRRLEEALQIEKNNREAILARERHAWETEIRVLREALAPLFKNEQGFQQKMTEIETKVEQILTDHAQTKSRISIVEDTKSSVIRHTRERTSGETYAEPMKHYSANDPGLGDGTALYCYSEGRASVSAEPLSPRQSSHIAAEPDSPRSSGILNLIELPRAALPRHTMPPRLSPPAEADEPRSSGFLALDVKELIHRRNIAKGLIPAQPYGSPLSSTTKSPPPIVNAANLTPQSLPRVSPPNLTQRSSTDDDRDRLYKKRKAELMALDVLADVSAASPVLS